MTVPPRVIDSERPAETRIHLTLGVDPGAEVFVGHFEKRPVLPGVAQIDWAVSLASRHFGLAGSFSGMEKIKFRRIIQPPAQVHLRLDWQADRGRLLFEYREDADGPVCSSGCLCFGR